MASEAEILIAEAKARAIAPTITRVIEMSRDAGLDDETTGFLIARAISFGLSGINRDVMDPTKED
jgi:Mn-containing catalase